MAGYQGGQLSNHTHGSSAGDGGSLSSSTTLMDSVALLTLNLAFNFLGV